MTFKKAKEPEQGSKEREHAFAAFEFHLHNVKGRSCNFGDNIQSLPSYLMFPRIDMRYERDRIMNAHPPNATTNIVMNQFWGDAKPTYYLPKGINGIHISIYDRESNCAKVKQNPYVKKVQTVIAPVTLCMQNQMSSALQLTLQGGMWPKAMLC